MRRIRADRRVGLLLAGAVLLTFVSLAATVALPASDADVRSPRDAKDLDARAERGMRVFRSEGCWYCHTMASRTTPADDVFGDALPAGAYADHSPALIGLERVGPDLSHVGDRYSDAGDLVALLRDPRREGRKSSMPSYDFLSDDDLEAIAAFLLAYE